MHSTYTFSQFVALVSLAGCCCCCFCNFSPSPSIRGLLNVHYVKIENEKKQEISHEPFISLLAPSLSSSRSSDKVEFVDS